MIQGPLSDIIQEDWHAILQGSYRGQTAIEHFQKDSPEDWRSGLWYIKRELEECDTQMAIHHTDKMLALIVEVAGHPQFVAQKTSDSMELLASVVLSWDVKDKAVTDRAQDYLRDRVGPCFASSYSTEFEKLYEKVRKTDRDDYIARYTLIALQAAPHINARSDGNRLRFWRSLGWTNIRANDFFDRLEEKYTTVKSIANQYRDYGLKLLREGGHGAEEILAKETRFHFDSAKRCEASFKGRDPISNARAACWRILAKAEIDALRIFKEESDRLNMVRRDVPKGPTGTPVLANDSLK